MERPWCPWQGDSEHQQGTFASDLFCWGVPRRAFLPLAPHPLAEPYSHPRMPPGSITLALEGALWAPSPSGGQEDSGLPLFQAETLPWVPFLLAGVGICQLLAPEPWCGFGMGLFSSPLEEMVEVLLVYQSAGSFGWEFPPFPPSLRGKSGNFSPFPFPFFPCSQRPRVRSLPFPLCGESALPAQGTPTAQVLGWFCCILGHSQPGAMGDTLEFQGVLVPAHSPKVWVV